MYLKDFHYDFPLELVAVQSIEPRSAARMMVIDRKGDTAKHSAFRELPNFLNAGDILVVNESTVLPARFYGRRKTGAKLEGLFLEGNGDQVRVWLKGKVKEGEAIEIDGYGEVIVSKRFEKDAFFNCKAVDFVKFLKIKGLMPLPPYIRNEREARGLNSESPSDSQVYQTVFANDDVDSKDGQQYSVASPTASLHFDSELVASLQAKGIEIEKISLYVGEGTFAPVMVENLNDHKMHTEHCEINSDVWSRLMRAKKEGRRIIAVGTTALRTLESAALRSKKGETLEHFTTDLFIRPPFEFQVASGLITNFHWPDSTLIVLVATFLEAIEAGERGLCKSVLHHRWRTYYDLAIRERYRLFSYGDGMLIL